MGGEAVHKALEQWFHKVSGGKALENWQPGIFGWRNSDGARVWQNLLSPACGREAGREGWGERGAALEYFLFKSLHLPFGLSLSKPGSSLQSLSAPPFDRLRANGMG
jgi:hypothetical protein